MFGTHSSIGSAFFCFFVACSRVSCETKLNSQVATFGFVSFVSCSLVSCSNVVCETKVEVSRMEWDILLHDTTSEQLCCGHRPPAHGNLSSAESAYPPDLRKLAFRCSLDKQTNKHTSKQTHKQMHHHSSQFIRVQPIRIVGCGLMSVCCLATCCSLLFSHRIRFLQTCVLRVACVSLTPCGCRC